MFFNRNRVHVLKCGMTNDKDEKGGGGGGSACGEGDDRNAINPTALLGFERVHDVVGVDVGVAALLVLPANWLEIKRNQMNWK